MKPQKRIELIWVFAIVALLLIVVIVSGIFYFSFAFGDAVTGHVVVSDESQKASENGFIDKVDFSYKVNDLIAPVIFN